MQPENQVNRFRILISGGHKWSLNLETDIKLMTEYQQNEARPVAIAAQAQRKSNSESNICIMSVVIPTACAVLMAVLSLI